METPLALREAHEKWTARRSPEQPAMSWKLEKWTNRFPQHEAFLTAVHEKPLDRAQVASFGEEITSEDKATELFLATMIWGFGNAGYGPFRAKRILDTPDAGANLLELAQIASQKDGLAAFDHFASKRRADGKYLKYLGPAFGTKYIYFAQMAKQPKKATPVMDAVIRHWFASNVPDTRLNLHFWDPSSYAAYVDHLTHWAGSLNPGDPLRLDQVEYLIFAGPRTNWSLPADSDAELSIPELVDRLKAHAETEESITAEATQLLDRLEQLFEPTSTERSRLQA
jgi:hypothetical protein